MYKDLDRPHKFESFFMPEEEAVSRPIEPSGWFDSLLKLKSVIKFVRAIREKTTMASTVAGPLYPSTIAFALYLSLLSPRLF